MGSNPIWCSVFSEFPFNDANIYLIVFLLENEINTKTNFMEQNNFGKKFTAKKNKTRVNILCGKWLGLPGP